MTRHPLLPLIAVLTALALAACSSEPVAPDGGTEQGSVAQPPAPSSSSEAATQAAIPAAMLGTWDNVEGTCDPASDLLLTIEPDRLLFYESLGTVQSVTLSGGDVTLQLAMMGEGEEWQETATYRLLDGGAILESEFPAPGGTGALRRKRCDD